MIDKVGFCIVNLPYLFPSILGACNASSASTSSHVTGRRYKRASISKSRYISMY